MSRAADIILECRDLNKRYRKTEAIAQATASFERGAIHGLLGANGAGKTTLLHILSGQIYPSSGECLYEGQPIHENPLAMSQICFVKSDERSWSEYKVKDLMIFCSLLIPTWDQSYAEQLLRLFHLSANKKYKNLSKGMQSLVGIVKGLASRCPVVLFDEPTLGLDADMRETFYDLLIRDYGESQRTIILSTHLIDESAKLFQYLTLLEHGKITSHLETEEFMKQAYYLQGNSSILERLMPDERVLHHERLGSTSIVVWCGQLEEEMSLRQQGVEISPVPLQKLFVYLTRKNKRSHGKEELPHEIIS
ncbi:ABC transporter ATP-binding protein YtrB [compost metagenome]